ncbi:MAG: OmpH family outer membrane protein [Acidaminococcaceae bacterium]|nr:OmpH family outer membrane protein [Acidaminococcaceae bacterium]HAY61921.1 hypothetical protein [Acidaminococcaceae bacterium]HCJ90347.1 hypothetical protein [Acidaminococcaceae bacterium]
MRWLTVILLLVALACSSCGFRQSGAEKIAVLDWNKVLEAHPDQVRLKRMKEEYNLLLEKRQEQEARGKVQVASLARLHQLKETSRRSYKTADYMVRLSERQAEEERQLAEKEAAVAGQAERELVSERQAVEDKYALTIFNLRLKLEGLKLNKDERARTNTELEQVLLARDRDRMAVESHKQALVTERMQADRQAMQDRMAAYAKELQGGLDDRSDEAARKDKELFRKAPESLQALLGSVDRELDKRQQEIELLEKSIQQDVGSIVMKLAKEKGYTIVFHKYKANISADDITQPVIQDLQKLLQRRKLADGLNKKADAEAAVRGQAAK